MAEMIMTEVIINPNRRFGPLGYLASKLASTRIPRTVARTLVQSTAAGPARLLFEGAGLRLLGTGLPIDGSQDCARDMMKAGAMGATLMLVQA